ncbi:hypothetical protein ACX9NE_26970 [Mycobacterium sp. ML4]
MTAEPRIPAEHYVIADRLVAELGELRPHELNLPYAKAKLAIADIHARLAQCQPMVGNVYVRNAVVNNQPTEGI